MPIDYFTDAELEAEVADDDLWLRLFDRDGDGTADSTVIDRFRTRAQNRIDAELRASHGTPWTSTDDVPALAKDIAMDLTLVYAAARTSDMSDAERGPFGARLRAAKEDLASLKSDRGARFPETGAPAPIATAADQVDVIDGGTVWSDSFDHANTRTGF